MARKRYKPEEIVAKLRQVDVLVSRGRNPPVLFRKSHPAWESHHRSRTMFALLHSLGMFVVDLFKSRRRLEAENLFLRHKLNIALRRAPTRLRLRDSDRALLAWMTLETILRWHRAGFT
jgi:putative transposase